MSGGNARNRLADERRTLSGHVSSIKGAMGGGGVSGYVRRAVYMVVSILLRVAFATAVCMVCWMTGVYLVPATMQLVVSDLRITGEISEAMLSLFLGFPFLFLTIMLAFGMRTFIRYGYGLLGRFLGRFKARVLPEHVKEGG